MVNEAEAKEAMLVAGISEDCRFASGILEHLDKNQDGKLEHHEL